MTLTRSSSRRLTAGLVAACLVITSCGSSSDSSKSTDSAKPTTTIDTAALGKKDPARGPVLKLGFIYDGQTTALDNSGDLTMAKAATGYVNDYLGGIAGRKLELESCATNQTPAGATDCVTQMVKAKVPVVLNGITGQAGSIFGPLSKAGIQVFVASADPRDAGATILTDGILALAAGPAKVFADAGVKRAAIIGIDVPAASAALKQSAALFYKKAGVDVDVVLIAPDTADMTPNVQAELTKNPGGMTVVGDPLFCTKAMSAIASSGFTGKLVIIPQCINDSFLESTTNLKGATMLTTNTSDPDSPEYKLYSAVAATYGSKGLTLGGTSPSAYQAVVGFARAMKGLTGEVNAESVKKQLADMPATPMPLADGLSFKCDGSQVSIAPAICSRDVLQTTLDAKGNPGSFTVLDGSKVLKLN